MKKLLFLVLITVLGATFIVKDKPFFTENVTLNVDAKAMILIDAESGKVLYEKNSKEALPIASMSKMMTQYIVLNAIKNGTLTWEDTYEPSEYVQQMTAQSGAVKLGMTPGNLYTVKELFTAMTVNSSNDAAVALAEMVSGSEEAFVTLMNQQAKSFGLKKTSFFNASGLDGDYIGKSADETNIASAWDVARIAQKLIERHPEVFDFTKMTDFRTSAGIQLWSTNLMLPGMPLAMAGVDGLKTGYTDLAGSCFASTGIFDGKRVISVVMGVDEKGSDTTNPRFQLTEELIEHFVLE
ncbi:D-alanyl-D-alanine carboxypeptidase family protein [Sporosarcina pasteurii]|uniref:D-alanyl-D-alanine carboxypeptidase dacA n=1 Tax=Sporosarcina pasteurii TaxID=1474 RepID=A0A380CLH1_SPOPA|nr:D-alanyl-D-alanine carboxypeptidase family protein [Sporosarcina pasteurii]MDS9471932.1 D-alanyl-D-alanine carboxypeptidase family protein [Sporosarcina pasteurii]SUJ21931.1 D-alanyl-D-alanine carboxypeptidase dacA precursor [Sporosarcina pasteurii]